MDNLIKYLKKNKKFKYLEDISMSMFNTYKVNPKAKLVVFPKDIDSLKEILKIIKENNYKYLILGNGSNVIFNFKYYNGVIIKLDYLNDIDINGTIVKVGAGYSLAKLSLKVAKLGLGGLEFASGIPGLVGASVAMNAGAYKSDMGYVVSKIKVLTPELEVKTMFNKDLNFHYRTSFLKENKDYICLEATIKLKRKNKEDILNLMNERKLKRIESQPLNYPSAGSVFRNPTGMYAGELIENVNLKGYSINGATVSTKHANFIINENKCSGSDIIALIELIQKKVYDKYKVNLVLEQIIID